MTTDGDDLGAVLRRLRKERGLTQRELAVQAETGISHLCRLESGDRAVLSRDLLARLGEVLGASHELAAAAGRLPEAMERAVLRHPHALGPGVFERRTLPALRRAEAAARAAYLLGRTPGAEQHGRVDPLAVCRKLGLAHSIETASGGALVEFVVRAPSRAVVIRHRGVPGDPGVLPRTRFLAAHAAAHMMAGQYACSFPRMTDAELVACDVAVHLLAPARLVSNALAEAGVERADVWGPDLGALISAVADRLAVPGWVAVRRLADEALLDDQALYLFPGGGGR